MNDQTLDPTLLLRFLKAELSADEREQIEQWWAGSPQRRAELEQLRQLWEQSGQARGLAQVDAAADWPQVWNRMQEAPAAPIRSATSRRSFFWRVAAAVALLITTAWTGWQFAQRADSVTFAQTYEAKDTVTTVSLPDGSQVYLNQGARLTYGEDFGTQTRTVQLTGEAYFEVSHNPAIPFLIRTAATTTRVVGTTFNVRTEDQVVRVTVTSGKVAFSHRQDTVLLTQNEVGLYENKTLRKQTNDDPNFLSWQTGVLTFDSTPLAAVVGDLERHYQVPIEVANATLNSLTLTSTFQRQPLEEVLEELRLTLDVDYTYQNNQITLQ
ncbi:MAG: FecR domain-containing protein [Tunicatimonas sp.]